MRCVPYDAPQDSGKGLKNNFMITGVHFRHLVEQSMTCDACHYGYDKKSGRWSIRPNHNSDTIRYDSSRCDKCHSYGDCTNAFCHSSTPEHIKIHDLHKRKVNETTGDTTGYTCNYCHKGYGEDIGMSPLDLPDNKHNNGIVDVDFNLPFPVDPLSAPTYTQDVFNKDNNSCDYVYCHGTTITGGKKRVLVNAAVDTIGNAECNFCHDTVMLATQVGEHKREDHQEYFSDCMNCHHEKYFLTTAITNKKYHINGKIDFDYCNSCHPLPESFQISADSVITKIPR